MSTDEYKNDLSGHLDAVAHRLEKGYGLLFKIRPPDAPPAADDGLAEVIRATLDALTAESGALTAIAEQLAALDDREDASDEDELNGCEASEAASSDFNENLAELHKQTRRERPSLLRNFESSWPEHPAMRRLSGHDKAKAAEATKPPETVEAVPEPPRGRSKITCPMTPP